MNSIDITNFRHIDNTLNQQQLYWVVVVLINIDSNNQLDAKFTHALIIRSNLAAIGDESLNMFAPEDNFIQ